MMNNELYHHGILGQKWGVRRYQNPDGTRTALGKQRQNGDSQKQKYEKIANAKDREIALKLKENNPYMSDAQLKVASKAMKRFATVAAVCGGVALAGGCAYMVYQSSNNPDKDFTISSKTMLQRLAFKDGNDLHDTFYAAVKKTDKAKYVNNLGVAGLIGAKRDFIKQVSISKDCKIAGNNSIKSAYDNLMKNNLNFNLAMGRLEKLSGKKGYDAFTVYGMLGKDNEYIKHTMQKELEKLGYSGMIDMNDVNWGNAQKPLIMFRDAAGAAVESSKRISDMSEKELKVNELIENAGVLGDIVGTDLADAAWVSALVTGGSAFVANYYSRAERGLEAESKANKKKGN